MVARGAQQHAADAVVAPAQRADDDHAGDQRAPEDVVARELLAVDLRVEERDEPSPTSATRRRRAGPGATARSAYSPERANSRTVRMIEKVA